jgi:ABC-2 type transport system permease protein
MGKLFSIGEVLIDFIPLQMPIAKSSILGGQLVASVVFMLVSIIAVLIVGFLIRFRSEATFSEWLLVVLLIIFFSLALTWISVPFELTAGSIEGASSFSYVLLMMLFVSSAFVPVDEMPKVVRPFAENHMRLEMNCECPSVGWC